MSHYNSNNNLPLLRPNTNNNANTTSTPTPILTTTTTSLPYYPPPYHPTSSSSSSSSSSSLYPKQQQQPPQSNNPFLQLQPQPPPQQQQQPNNLKTTSTRTQPQHLQSQKRTPWSSYSCRMREGKTSLILPVSTVRRNLREDDDGFAPESGEEEYGRGASRAATAQKRERERELLRQRELSQQRQAQPVPQRRIHRRTRHIYRSEKEMEALAQVEESLCPIRLDLDVDNYKLRDSFTWNMNERHMTPQQFAEILCDDLDLPAHHFVAAIAESIKSQVGEFETYNDFYVVDDEDETNSRLTINLDLQLGQLLLRDRFEWDLNSPWPTPDDFARMLCADLGVGGEFVSCVAHAIHEQIYRHRRDRLSGVDQDFGDDLNSQILTNAFRTPEEAETWAPVMELLSPEALEKVLLDKERNIRRMRREMGRVTTANILSNNRRRVSGFTPYGPAGRRNVALSASPTRRGPGRPPRTAAGDGKLSPEELSQWRCVHCGVDGFNTPVVRKGPDGPKSLCNACGLYVQVRGRMPEHRRDMFYQ